MAARRHNLSRRAVLGAGVVAPAFLADVPSPFGVSLSNPALLAADPEGRDALRQAQGERVDAKGAPQARWDRALAAFRRAEAKLAAFRAYEQSLPPDARAWPACEPLEERFGDLDCARLAALRRLLRAPAPDGPSLALKLDLLVVDQAWELDSADATFAALRADARRLLGTSSSVNGPA